MDPLHQEMRKARILIVDDAEDHVALLQRLLRRQGYVNVQGTTEPRSVAALHKAEPFDLILLDIEMPGLDGIGVIEQIRPLVGEDFLPVIMVTGYSDEAHRLNALRHGARDYILKPFVAAEVLQRVANYLEVRLLYRDRKRQAEILSERVREQVMQLERLSRLKRFFSPQLAELIVAGGVDDPLRTHRREIVSVSIDLRGFTAFTEAAEPEEVIRILREYHAEMGRLILKHQGTIEFFAGDGIMVIFNDPVPVADAAGHAVRMALEMQEAFGPLGAGWEAQGYHLGLGIGLAKGVATIGTIGFEGRWDYAAIGSVMNLASRLCAQAKPGQVLVDRNVQSDIAGRHPTAALQELRLKGFPLPVPAFTVERGAPAAQATDASAVPTTSKIRSS